MKREDVIKMGLDMYLKAKMFFWTEDYKTGRQNKNAEKIKAMFPEMKGNRLDYVIFQVGYWRKANAIHDWFVQNVQKGKDECQDSYVSREKLIEPKKICEEIIEKSVLIKAKVKMGDGVKNGKVVPIMEDGETIKNPEVAKELLPTRGGFFFGCTDYDEYYMADIKKTIEILDRCLKLPDSFEFYYNASW